MKKCMAWLRKAFIRFLYILPVLLILFPVFLMIAENLVYARVGGGDRYPGGGGGGGGDGAGYIIYLLIRLCIAYPHIGIPVVIVVVVIAYKSGYFANNYNQGRVIRKGRQMQAEYARQSAVQNLTNRDPGFHEQGLLDRVRKAFFRLQEAWCNQDMRPVRHFLSDGIFERLTLQLNVQKEKGLRYHTEKLNVKHIRLVQMQSDQVFDTVTIRIVAEAVDYLVNAKTGKYVEGSKDLEEFTEFWSFVRRPGARMRQMNGLMEGNCPNCGAGLSINASAKCDSCGSLIKSGAYDWVLAEITQASEWQVKEDVELPGVVNIRQLDPGFSIQHIEDRVSVMFWRQIEAFRKGKLDPLRKVASEEFCQSFPTRIKPNEKGERVMYDDAAVGAVETWGVIVGSAWDVVLVQVRWSAKRMTLDSKGQPIKTIGSSIYTHIYIIKRKHGVKSDLNEALSSAHCPNCGAPELESTSNACEYCGTVLNDGSQDWILDGIESPYRKRVQELLTQMRQPAAGKQPGTAPTPPPPPMQATGITGGIEAVAWMMNVMLADQKIDPKERKLIFEYAAARDVSKREAENMLSQAMQWGKIEAPEPRTKEEARSWLADMAEMALADGFVCKEEMQTLLHVGKKLGFSASDIKLLVNKTRSRLYKQAKVNVQQIKRTQL